MDTIRRRERAYRTRLVQQKLDGGELWTAEHPDLPGCHVVRRDPVEAISQLANVRQQWLDRANARNADIPQPDDDFRYEIVLDPEHTPTEAQTADEAVKTAGGESKTIFLDLVPTGPSTT